MDFLKAEEAQKEKEHLKMKEKRNFQIIIPNEGIYFLKNYKITFNKLTLQQTVSHGKIPIAFLYFSINLHSLYNL